MKTERNEMLVVRGDGRIFKNLDEAGVIMRLKEAQAEKDKFASVLGWLSAGYKTFQELEKKAGYKGATENQCLESLRRFSKR
jgi:hypothetical protein